MRMNQPVTQQENDSMANDEFICSKTDTSGVITYVNDVFCRIAGYSEDELIGQSHNIVRHPDMPCVAFAWCWDTLSKGRTWQGIVKNRCKSGDHYWVDAVISPRYDEQGMAISYFAARRKPMRDQITAAEPLYAELCRMEGTLDERGRLTRQAISELYKGSPLYGK